MSSSSNYAEPSLEQLAALRKAAGDEAASLSFIRESAGTRVILRTTERPPREWATQIAPGLEGAQAAALWAEFAARVAGSSSKTVATTTGSAYEQRKGDIPEHTSRDTPSGSRK